MFEILPGGKVAVTGGVVVYRCVGCGHEEHVAQATPKDSLLAALGAFMPTRPDPMVLMFASFSATVKDGGLRRTIEFPLCNPYGPHGRRDCYDKIEAAMKADVNHPLRREFSWLEGKFGQVERVATEPA